MTERKLEIMIELVNKRNIKENIKILWVKVKDSDQKYEKMVLIIKKDD